METYKLKVKIGEHEFDAEGPTDVVQRQFAVFRELIAAMRAGTPTDPPTVTQTPPGTEGPPQNPVRTDLGLDRIMRADRRVVSLTVRAQSIQDEILLLLLGQKKMRKNDSVTGAEILDGLRLTGRQIPRVDYQLDKLTAAGDTITIGKGRARRYRLTNKGFPRAQGLAMALLKTVA